MGTLRATIFWVLGLAMALHSPPARAEDPWLGPDKALHFSVSAGLAAGGYGLTAIATDSRPTRLAVGVGGALALGLAKELYDATGAGAASGRDIVWDALGALTGALVALGVDRLITEIALTDPGPAGHCCR